MVDMVERDFDKPTLAIVCFGPAMPTTGFKVGEYYQVTINPAMCSPSGDYIRFGFHQADEIHGWQRVAAMTVVEVLGDSDKPLAEGVSPTQEGPLRMMTVE